MPDSADPREPLVTAALLAAAGGLLDAFVYLNHGHVFANAMTGNVVLLGASVLTHSWYQALHHTIPLIAFLLGIAASRGLRDHLGHHAVIAGLGLEAISLAAIGCVPSSAPNLIFTAGIAFVASYQVETLRHVDQFSYNSTFMTSNLRSIVEGLWDSSSQSEEKKRRRGLREAIDLGCICACFLAGAVAGALLPPAFGNRTLWFTLPLLALAGWTLLKKRRETST